ncbi:MAG: STAS domain-containing protein [Erysipelotrichales bacterium]|nr:STAS domain-containing protein [Erysipelotrichales bacterium]
MLRINMEYRKGILFVRLKGNLNANTAPKFEEYAIPIIKDYGIKYIVYNLSELISLDTYGEKALIKGGNEAKVNDGKVLIVNNRINSCLDYDNVSNELIALDLLKV